MAILPSFHGGCQPCLPGFCTRDVYPLTAALGATRKEASLLVIDTFDHAAGLLLLAHTGRIRMFAASAFALFERYLDERIERLQRQGVLL